MIIKKIIFLLFVFALFAMSSCVQCNRVARYERLSVEEFNKFILQPDVQIVDIRTAEDFNAGHIPGSINIDVTNGHEELASRLDPERPVAIYCNGGRQSEQAAFVLKSVFFRNVVDVDGGYKAWVKSSTGE